MPPLAPKPKKKKTRRTYTDDEKQDFVAQIDQLVAAGKEMKEGARIAGITYSNYLRWQKNPGRRAGKVETLTPTTKKKLKRGRQGKRFTEAQKRKRLRAALKLMAKGATQAAAAKEVGINGNTVAAWRKLYPEIGATDAEEALRGAPARVKKGPAEGSVRPAPQSPAGLVGRMEALETDMKELRELLLG